MHMKKICISHNMSKPEYVPDKMNLMIPYIHIVYKKLGSTSGNFSKWKHSLGQQQEKDML